MEARCHRQDIHRVPPHPRQGRNSRAPQLYPKRDGYLQGPFARVSSIRLYICLTPSPQVLQTGDLASLNYLNEHQLKLFPSLQILRDSLYSADFRKFIRNVTGCGPLSARRDKQDMSVNSYKKTCHLLNHDDVIGSRCVSYVLYMPIPIDKPWQQQWGGALELYPLVPGSNPSEPATTPSKSIPP